MFTVDTRCPQRPEGDWCSPKPHTRSYFAGHAEAWEGITYMKSRAVAGNVERATDFLHELQDVDWRRYGQSMRSREELAEMRARLERSRDRAIRSRRHGRLLRHRFRLDVPPPQGAGIFYKVLNTPEAMT